MDVREKIKYLKQSDNFWKWLFRDFPSVLMIFVMISSIFYITMGRISPAVAVERGCMISHIRIGDMIFVTKGYNPKTNSAYDQKGSIWLCAGLSLDLRTGEFRRICSQI